VRQLLFDAVQLAFDEATESGLVDRPIHAVVDEVEGLPRGDAFSVLQSWRGLAEQGCVAIIGPLISDNAVAVREHIETIGRIPTVTWSGTDRFYGEWCFSIGNGSLPDEPYLMAEFLAAEGATTVGVVRELSVPGEEYASYFLDACRREGLQIVYVETLGQLSSDVDAVAQRLHDRNPDSVAYFGFGLPAMDLNDAFARLGWNPLRVLTTAFVNAYLDPDWMRRFRGWVGVDQYDEENLVGQAFLDRFDKRFGYRPENCIATVAYDTGVLIANGVSKASPLSPAGVKEGLERVKVVPAASGAPGTRLGLGPWIRRAWHGCGYLVMREVDDTGQRTRLRARFRP
jgi:ABC-type branched-subunit amino acid transport system substrate-binding protein